MSENRDGKPKRAASGYWSMHPQTRLAYEIMPYLRELDDRYWTPKEQEFLEFAERRAVRPLEEWEKRLLGRAGADDRRSLGTTGRQGSDNNLLQSCLQFRDARVPL